MTKVLSDLQFFIFIVIPITLSLIFLPNFVNPHLIENIKLNFKIILISEKYCSINKIYCNLIIQQNEKNPDLLRRIEFEYFDFIYIVNHWIYSWDQFIIKLFIKFLKIFIVGLILRQEMSIEFWNKTSELFQIMLAISNSMTYHMIYGFLISRMYTFFIFAIIITVGKPWERIINPVISILRTNNVC